jgi:heat shock protein HslJ
MMMGAAKGFSRWVAISAVLIAMAACGQASGESGGSSSSLSTASAGSSLDGTRWKLTGWTLNSLNPADFTITARFAEGQISGNSGVNTYGGPYRIGPGAAFSAGPLASTQMAGPEPAMRAETAYLTLLGQAKSYKMAGGVLTLYDGGGNESLIFEGT